MLGHLEHTHHVVMLYALNDLHFTQKHRAKFRMRGELAQHGLYGHEALVAAHGRALTRHPHASHAATPDADKQFIVAEKDAWLELTHRKKT